MVRSFSRVCALILLSCVLLAGCAPQLDRVGVAVGVAALQSEPAAPYAMQYLPYARMASLAYLDRKFQTNPGAGKGRLGSKAPAGLCPDRAALQEADNKGDEDAKAALKMLKYLSGWTCDFGVDSIDNCPKDMVCKGGLEYRVWRNGCSDAVIAYRGTSGLIGDWLSNLRWFTPYHIYDHYDQVKDDMPTVIGWLRAKCPNIRITATGHSLGGGLAQFTGHANPEVSYVYAFDPSPVTAYFDVKEEVLRKTGKRHGVDRVYQAGEVLAVPRALTSGIFPIPSCGPPVRIVRFNTDVGFDILERHKLSGLIADMEQSIALANAKRPKGNARPRAGRYQPMDPLRCTTMPTPGRP